MPEPMAAPKTTVASLLQTLEHVSSVLLEGLSDIEKLEVLLSLTLLKRASDVFESRYEKNLHSFMDEGLSEKDAREAAEDPDLYIDNESLSFFVPPASRWSNIRDQDFSAGIAIGTAFQQLLHDNEQLLNELRYEIDLGRYKQLHSNHVARQIINDFDRHPLNEEALEHSDVVAITCDHLIERLGESSIENYTPASLCSLMVRLAEPNDTTKILDPYAGSGGLLAAAKSHIESGKEVGSTSLTGYEKYAEIRALCVLNMIMHGFSKAHIYLGDSLYLDSIHNDCFEKFDVVISHPPFGRAAKDRYHSYRYRYQSSTKDMLAVQQMLLMLKPTGTAVALVPSSSLTRSFNSDRAMRRFLVEEGYLIAVISLPSSLLKTTNIPVCLIVLGATEGKREKQILFMNAAGDFESYRYGNRLRPGDVERIVDVYQDFVRSETVNCRPNYATVIKGEAIAASDYNLDVSLYTSSLDEARADTEDHEPYIKGIPQSEIEKHRVLFQSYKIDPWKDEFLVAVKGLRQSDENHYDFFEADEREYVKELVDSDDTIKEQESEFMQAAVVWWKTQFSQIPTPLESQQLKDLRIQLLDTFEEAVQPFEFMEPHRARGAIANWWEGNFAVPAKIQLLPKLGRKGLLESVVNSLSTLDELDSINIVDILIPDYTEQLSSLDLEVELVEQKIEGFNHAATESLNGPKNRESRSKLLTIELRSVRKSMRENNNKISKLKRNVQNIEEQGGDVEALNEIIADIEDRESLLQKSAEKIEGSLAPYKEMKRQRAALIKRRKQLKNSLDESLRKVVEEITDSDAVPVVERLLWNDLAKEIESALVEQRQQLTKVFEQWWDKYHLGSEDIVNISMEELLLHRGIECLWHWRGISGYGARPALSGSDLSNTQLGSADLSEADLRDSDLSSTFLRHANLTSSDLSGANIVRADLQNANLTAIHALGTDFSGADFSGACIEDWNINASTNLDDVKCSHIYLKAKYQERRPSDPNKKFAPGEFVTLVRSTLDTVDLIFQDGIDWTAFHRSFQELQQQYSGSYIAIQGIERKEGAFVIRLEVDAGTDKGQIESAGKELYERERRLLEAQYKAELKVKDTEIQSYRRENARLGGIVDKLAERPISNFVNVEAKAMTNQSQSTDGRTINTDGGDYRETTLHDQSSYAEGDYNNISQSQQSLAAAAAEIQQLLDQLSKTYGIESTSDKLAITNQFMQQVEKDASFSARLLSAFKSGGVAALDQFLSSPASSFVIAALDDWQKTKAIESDSKDFQKNADIF